MIVAIHNVSPANDNRAARFAEMQREVKAMTETVNGLLRPGVIDSMVKDALRPLAAEIALQEKEERDQVRNNRSHNNWGFKLPKGD